MNFSATTCLAAQHCDPPPYRAVACSYTYHIYIFLGIAGYRAIHAALSALGRYCRKSRLSGSPSIFVFFFLA